MQKTGLVIPYGHQQLDDVDRKSVLQVLRSFHLTQGPKSAAFEKTLCDYTGAKYAVAVANGTAALHIAALAADIRGKRVVISPITFAASVNSILYGGGVPSFIDIEPKTGNIDADKIEDLLQKKSAKKIDAIMPVHLGGHPVDLPKIGKLARAHRLMVIEDASHALGARYAVEADANGKIDWVKVGSCWHSDMSIFSFHPVKSITTGEGGAVLTNRADLYEKLCLLRNHGITKDRSMFRNRSHLDGPWYYEMQVLGFNYRLSDIQCALGITQLRKLDAFICQRREIALAYLKKLSDVQELELPIEKETVRSAWHLFLIKVRGKNASPMRFRLFNYLREKGIGVQVHYIPVYRHPFYRRLGFKKNDCPQAEDYYTRVISIPIFPGLKKNNLNKTVSILKQGLLFLQRHASRT